MTCTVGYVPAGDGTCEPTDTTTTTDAPAEGDTDTDTDTTDTVFPTGIALSENIDALGAFAP